MNDDDRLSPDDSNTIRFLTRNHRIASKSIPRIMSICRAHLSHEEMGRLHATTGRGTTPDDRYTAVMAIVGPLLANEEGEEEARAAFAEMMNWRRGRAGVADQS